ncbi:MAG: ABC transporter substrate-binding protein [Thermodesulfobacteria bacterium]|nr:ABC transporter substrate-binding protein [Thermodesulfobacteriota bacterium]
MDRRSLIKKGAVAAGALVAANSATKVSLVHASEKRFRWRMVTSWPPAFPILQTGVEEFAKRVGELTQGRLTIQVYAGGELVPPLGVFDAVSSGSVQCGHSAAYYWAGKCNAAQWFTSIPFGLDAQGMNAWFYDGNGLKLWEEVYSKFNLVPRPAGNTGVQMGGWFNKKIEKMSDFKGLKMRIPGIGGKVIAKAGGAVTLLPAGEIYTSLERGVIDATEWIGPFHDMRMGFYKVAKYYYGPGWHEPGSTLELIMNKKAYDELPPELKAALDTAAAELNVKMLSEFEAKNAMALQELKKDKRVQILRFPDNVLEGLRKLSEETIKEIAAKDPMSKKVNDDFQKFKKMLAPWNRLTEKAYYDFML